MDGFIEEAEARAKEALNSCSTENGMYASGGRNGYTSVWARDSMITLIGATARTTEYEKVFEKSLSTLERHQSEKGQIPNDVDIFETRKLVTFATIDSSLWFVLGEHFYKKKFGAKLRKRHAKGISKAMTWVSYQDAGEDMLPEQQPTSDWMDCFPHKYGHTINTQALYYGCLRATNPKIADKFRKKADHYLWSKKLGYYLPWHWKDHGEYSEKEEWFDSLGNLLAIVFGLADEKKAKSILSFIEKKKINRPYPVRALYPAIRKNSREWKDYFEASLAGEPNDYLNGGIWPFIGGFYVCALAEAGMHSKAKKELELLAKANSLGKKKEWDFNEWISPTRKKAEGGRHQAWSAGMFLAALEAVEKKRNPLKI